MNRRPSGDPGQVGDLGQVGGVVGAARSVGEQLVAAAEPGANAVVSPWSLTMAVAMLRAGAGPEAGAEIDALFGYPARGRGEVLGAVAEQLARLEGDPDLAAGSELPGQDLLHSARAVFTQAGYAIGGDYLHALSGGYGAEQQEVDFAADGLGRVGAWAARHTGGHITSSGLQPDPDLRMVLADAIVMAGRWQVPFRVEATRLEPFTRLEGTAVEVPMMHRRGSMRQARGEGWQAVDLPYSGGMLMRLVLPEVGRDPRDVEAATLREVDRALAAAGNREVDLALPRWNFAVAVDLMDRLRATGLETALAPRAGLYPAINPELYVSAAVQQAMIRVDEAGTVAAALTTIAVSRAVAWREPVVMRFDHPFRFEILDGPSGAPLFAGIVADPTAG